MTLRPGQITPNELELAILQRLSLALPTLESVLPQLHVQSRQYTGVGCYTKFRVVDIVVGSKSPVTLDEAINVPGIQRGLDALLFLKDGKVDFLEVVSFDELWEGTFEGFSIGTDKTSVARAGYLDPRR